MMKNKTKFILIVCAIIVYIIALMAFHLDYEYARYGMNEESSIIIIATLLYMLAICVLLGVINRIKKVKNTEEAIENSEANTHLEPIKEEVQISTNNRPEESLPINNDEDNQYIGTGIIGLKNYTDFCQIIGILAVLSGILCVIYAVACSGYSAIFIMLAIYLVTGGIGCFILSALLKAIITITKAAKLYLDINKKEEE